MPNSGRHDAYAQLNATTRLLNDAIVALCQSVVGTLSEVAEPQRSAIAGALTAYAVQMRDMLQVGGEFKILAETIDFQTKELAGAKGRLDKVRSDLQKTYRGVSETSPLRTSLVILDEHLAEIEKNLNAFGPAPADV